MRVVGGRRACWHTQRCVNEYCLLRFRISEQSKKDRRLILTVLGISVSFVCLCAPLLWNVLRQLLMNYNSGMVLQARGSGEGNLFNYEYHIVVFVLCINNCLNFYIYMLSGATWRKKFIELIIANWRKLSRRMF